VSDASSGTATSGAGLTAEAIARRVGGELTGDPAVRVMGIAPIERASARDATVLAGARYAAAAATTTAGVVLVAPAMAGTPTPHAAARIVVAQPVEVLLTLAPEFFVAPARVAGVHPSAIVGAGAHIPPDAAVGPFAIIGDGAHLGARVTVHAHAVVGPGVRIGDDCDIGPHATLHPGAELGQRVRVGTGCAIATPGFKYVFRDGAHRHLPHVGRCVLEDDVALGANCCVDRGSLGDTIIGAGTKLDNLVHVAHNVRIGRACLIMAQVGIAGSSQLGDGVVLTGQVGVVDNVSIGERAIIGAQSGVVGSVPAGETWSGFPARPHKEQLRGYAAVRRLTELLKPLERLLRDRSGGDPA
jgi:UDP-3-O-[3-hydroxymyristoyl] glucosamine N-acyltransferase